MNAQELKTTTDGIAVAAGLAGIMQWLPPMVGLISGLLTCVWLCIRIFESQTVQDLVNGDKKDAKHD